MKEQHYQKKISDKLEIEGWYVIKLIKTTKNGIPDLLALKDNRTMFIEVKTPVGKLAKLQEFRLSELKERGFECYYTKGSELIKW
jgi:Holliday junction resolvase